MHADESTTEIITTAERIPSDSMGGALTRVSPEQLKTSLATYDQNRAILKEWINSHLVKGTHWGYPAGEPVSEMRGKVRWYLTKTKRGDVWVPETTWKPKPSLYQAGAQTICDLMQIEITYEPDLAAWQMSGSKPGSFFYRCRLSTRQGVILGDGIGAGKTGEGIDSNDNNAAKKAQKRALVAAVINVFNLSELYGADDDGRKNNGNADANSNPTPKANGTTVPPRSEAVSKDELQDLFATWQDRVGGSEATRTDFRDWAWKTFPDIAEPLKITQWTKPLVARVLDYINPAPPSDEDIPW